MYEVMAFWETAGPAADQAPFERDFTEIWRSADKIVYPRTLDAVSSARKEIPSRRCPVAARPAG